MIANVNIGVDCGKGNFSGEKNLQHSYSLPTFKRSLFFSSLVHLHMKIKYKSAYLNGRSEMYVSPNRVMILDSWFTFIIFILFHKFALRQVLVGIQLNGVSVLETFPETGYNIWNHKSSSFVSSQIRFSALTSKVLTLCCPSLAYKSGSVCFSLH